MPTHRKSDARARMWAESYAHGRALPLRSITLRVRHVPLDGGPDLLLQIGFLRPSWATMAYNFSPSSETPQ